MFVADGGLAAAVVVEACVAVTVKTLCSAVTPVAVRVPTKLAVKKPQFMFYLLLLITSDLKVVWEAGVSAGRVGEVFVDDCGCVAVVFAPNLQ